MEKQANIAAGSISKWDYIRPSLSAACRVAKALGVTVNDLAVDYFTDDNSENEGN